MKMEIKEEKKEKVCIVVLSALSRFVNMNLINLQLAMETMQYVKKNDMPIKFSAIISKRVAENIIKLGNLETEIEIEIESLEEYRGVTSVCEEIIEVCSRMKKKDLNKYILIVQKDLVMPAKKFMENYNFEMVDVVCVSGGDGLNLNFFLIKNAIIGKICNYPPV